MMKSFRKSLARKSSVRKTSARPAVDNAARSTVETLETRRLLSSWSAQDVQIGLDKETANYPSITGAGEAIVVIDNGGVDYNHPALGGGYGNKVEYAWNYDANSWDVMPYDNNAHATGVAGEAAGSQHTYNGQLYQGVAPGAKIIAFRASGTWNVKQAFDWVVANRTKYNIVSVNYTDETGGVDQTQIYGDLINLQNSGVFVGGPVGNYGPGTAWGTYNNDYYQTGSVNAGDALSSFTPRGSAVNFVAPGEVVLDYYYNGQHIDYPGSGTSWASPQVVGLAALIKQVSPGFSTQQVYQIMRDSAHYVWDGYSNQSYARIDANAAVALAYSRSGQTANTGGGLQGTGGGTTTPAAGSTPFSGTPFTTGSAIRFANYDNGGEGVAYHDTLGWDEGDQASYRSGNVDLGWSNAEAMQYVGWTHAGEWMNYTMNVASAGTYNIALRTGGAASGGTFHVEVDGKNVSGTVTVPNTGSWDSYQTVNVSGVALTAGNHVVRIVMDANDAYGFTGNFSTMQFNAAGAVAGTGGGSTGSTGTYTPVTWTVPNGPFAFGTSGATSKSLAVNFFDTANNEASYVIKRATSPGGVYSIVATVNVDQATSQGTGWRSWTDWNVSAGTTYYYIVTANNQYGASSATSGSGTTTWS